MADAPPMILPEGAVAYGKGDAFQRRDFNSFSVAGQMVAGEALSTFCFMWARRAGTDEPAAPTVGPCPPRPRSVGTEIHVALAGMVCWLDSAALTCPCSKSCTIGLPH